jgi:hypothetical protein
MIKTPHQPLIRDATWMTLIYLLSYILSFLLFFKSINDANQPRLAAEYSSCQVGIGGCVGGDFGLGAASTCFLIGFAVGTVAVVVYLLLRKRSLFNALLVVGLAAVVYLGLIWTISLPGSSSILSGLGTDSFDMVPALQPVAILLSLAINRPPSKKKRV